MQILHAIPLVEITDDHPAVIQPVTVYPTRISLSSWRGCNLKCQYCVLQQDPVAGDPFTAQRVSTVADLLDAYDRAVAEAADLSRLKITINDHTDPFLKPEISADTLAIVEALARRKVTAPVMITTKLNPGSAVIRKLAQIAGDLKLTMFVSVADFSEHNRVELDNVEDRFAAIREFAEHGLHTVLYLKPIGPWTDIRRMSEYLCRYQPWITEVIMAPLKGDVSSCGLPSVPVADYDFGGEAENRIVEAIHAVNPAIKVSRKRSCAVNRQHQLACMPPLFGNQDSQPASDLFANAVSLKGYCEVRPAASFAGRPDLYLALSCVSELLEQLEVRWALIGSMQRAVDAKGTGLDAVNDIDIAVSKADFPRIHQRLKSQGLALEASMGCDGSCSIRGGAKSVLGEVIILDDYRYNIRLRVAGVMVDITTKERAVIATGTRAL
jgi:hypothetical protein